MSARTQRIARWAIKGFAATFLAQLVLFLQPVAPFTWENVWAALVMPPLVGLLLALEKGLQPETR